MIRTTRRLAGPVVFGTMLLALAEGAWAATCPSTAGDGAATHGHGPGIGDVAATGHGDATAHGHGAAAARTQRNSDAHGHGEAAAQHHGDGFAPGHSDIATPERLPAAGPHAEHPDPSHGSEDGCPAHGVVTSDDCAAAASLPAMRGPLILPAPERPLAATRYAGSRDLLIESPPLRPPKA